MECECCHEPIDADTACWSPSGKMQICPFCDASGCAPEYGQVCCDPSRNTSAEEADCPACSGV